MTIMTICDYYDYLLFKIEECICYKPTQKCQIMNMRNVKIKNFKIYYLLFIKLLIKK